MDIRRYEKNGEAWEAGELKRVRYAGEPCMQLDMRGNLETFFGESSEIIEVADLGDGWTRYWYVDTDPELRDSNARLVELYEQGRARGWND